MSKSSILSVLAVQLLISGMACAQPAAGDTYTYRVINVYNNETRGQVTYRIDSINADRVTVAVTPSAPDLGLAHTDIYTANGNWLRHPVINHDQPVEHEFATPYPAYVFPLDTGKKWSVRVEGRDAATGQRRSVRVDGAVLGTERVTTPAGAFDTIKVRRRVYAGDWDHWRWETNIEETDWYAPSLGRPVRKERNSGYIDQIMCGISNQCLPVRGDWYRFELVSLAKR
jgi:hypothetical protein